MRYLGQGHEIAVSLPVEPYGEQHVGIFRKAFEDAYTRLYGRIIDGVDIEVLSWTLTISASAPETSLAPGIKHSDRPLPEPVSQQVLFDPAQERYLDAPVYYRDQMQPGDRISGPALITEDQTTTVVTSNYDAAVDVHGHIVLTGRDGAAQGEQP
jgi:N-methylhydantoinase A